MKILLSLLVLIPNLSWGASTKDIEKVNCNFYSVQERIELKIHNHSNKKIESVTIGLKNPDNGKIYEFKEKRTVNALSGGVYNFYNVFFVPETGYGCQILDANFEGWFN